MNLASEITNRVPIKEGLELYGVRFDTRGYACCPFHKEKTGSFRVYSKDHAKCFGCGWYGSIIDFVSQQYGLNFKQTCVKIDYDFSLGLTGRRLTLSERKTQSEEIKIDNARLVFKDKLNREILNDINTRQKIWALSIKFPEYEFLAKEISKLDRIIDLKMGWYKKI